MAGNARYQEIMLQTVADALGPELLAQVAFVGGCTTALLITDEVTREGVRYTEDVDLIVHVLGYGGWHAMLNQLRPRGFFESPQDDVNCRLRLRQTGQNDLIVDFMPDDAAVLGFTNRWYCDALASAQLYSLNTGARIRLVTPVHFVATKLEAYQGRGNNDPLASRDVEDLINLVDGRDTLPDEIGQSDLPLVQYIADQFKALLAHPDFAYNVQSAARGSSERENMIFDRWETIANLSKE